VPRLLIVALITCSNYEQDRGHISDNLENIDFALDHQIESLFGIWKYIR
jgi:hypothetical protein